MVFSLGKSAEACYVLYEIFRKHVFAFRSMHDERILISLRREAR